MTHGGNACSFRKLALALMLGLICLLAVGADTGDTNPVESCTCGPSTESEGGVSLKLYPVSTSVEFGKMAETDATLNDAKGAFVDATFKIVDSHLNFGVNPKVSEKGEVEFYVQAIQGFNEAQKKYLLDYFIMRLAKDPETIKSDRCELRKDVTTGTVLAALAATEESVMVQGTAKSDPKKWAKATFVVSIPVYEVKKAVLTWWFL